MWQNVLQADVTQADRAIYEKLRRQVIENELISDKLLALDVRSTAGNDDFYFVFEDFILQTLFVFSRDETVSQIRYVDFRSYVLIYFTFYVTVHIT